MNALGISLAWTAVQVTLFCLVGTVVYLAARRRPASRAGVLCGTLIVTVGITALSVSPWPRWWTVTDFRLAVRDSGTVGSETPPREKSAPSDATNEAAQEVDTSRVNAGLLSFLSGMWNHARSRLADSSPAEQGNARWRWPAWLAAVMLLGMGVGLARVLLGAVGLAKLLRDTRPVDDPALLCLIEQLRADLRCRQPIEMREMTCCGGGSPAVVGWRRPTLLLPADWRSWSAEARRGILAHETAHVAHGDFLMGLAAQAGVVVHFYNPLVHWLAQRLRLEQELAADACGAALAGGATAYATLLAKMALRHDEFQPLWAGRPFFPTRGTLMRRIEMLQNRTVLARSTPSRFGLVALLTTLTLIGLGLAGVRGPGGRARAADPSPADTAPRAGSPAEGDGLLPAFDDSYLPADAIAVMSVKPLRVANSTLVEPVLLSFPSAFGFAFSTADNGVDEVKTIVFSGAKSDASSPNSGDSTEPPILGIYRLREPYERDKLRVRLFGEAPDGVTETTCHGYHCFQARSDASGLLVDYLLVDGRTFVMVRDRDLPRVLAADPKSHPSWYGEWRKVAGSPLAAGFDPAAVDALDEGEKDSFEDVFFSVLKNTTLFFGRVDSTTEGLAVSATALCKSSEAAVEASQAAKAALALARMALPQFVAPQELPKEYQALDIGGHLVQALANLKVEVNETRVEVEGKLDAAFATRLAEATKALVSRQTEEFKARDKEDEQAHLAKLGRLAEALNAYHDEHGHYPPAAVVGPDGKTLHSWRVELLPYLAEQELFESYKLDEPWDSEHNKRLVDRIPSIYGTSVWSQKGDADYFVVTGKGTLFDADQPGRREGVADAPGETILVLESRQRIPWTKPADIETTADHDSVRPFRGHGKGFYAAFADGTVKFVSKATDAASVRAMFTKAGGDEVKLR
ncbi:MAG TPA: M56 family metallopeptidase [Pirellulales bacterium]|jgi:beta-lactamase regulating signal transducer with metallopeptidase domain|nr:M56 family metallopeptidase [Pirellulales bacterium]